MRRFTHISLMLTALLACLMPGHDLWAEHGHGGSQDRGGKSSKGSSSFHGNGGGKKLGGGAIYPGKANAALAAKRGATKPVLSENYQPSTKRPAQEERKLDHGKQTVAEHPPGGADKSLNDSGDFFSSTNKKLKEVDGELTGPEKAAAWKLRNEVWKLKMRMELVKRMRALGEETGNEKLLEAADRLQQHALDQFHQRMEKLAEFRRRHGLPDLKQHFAP